MIQSMTGYATTTSLISLPDSTPVTITFHLKTLNSRYFEANCKLPYSFLTIETDIIQALKKQIRRGTVYCTMVMNPAQAFFGVAQPSPAMISHYLKAIEKIKQAGNIRGEITLSDIIQLPHILEAHETIIDESIKEQIMPIVHETIVKLKTSRIQDGKAIEQDFSKRIKLLEQLIDTITIQAQQILDRRTQEIGKTVHSLAQDISMSEAIAEAKKSALYLELDKMDVNEEIVRFKSHLKNLEKIILSEDNEIGKRLDFTLQELTREANTLASKAPAASISTDAISIKVELEKIRELAQNIV